MSIIISSDEDIGFYINCCFAVTEFIYILYNEIRNINLNILGDEIIMLIIGFLSYYKFFKNYKIFRLLVLYLWNRGLNSRINAYPYDNFIWFEHFRSFCYLTVGILPFIRGT